MELYVDPRLPAGYMYGNGRSLCIAQIPIFGYMVNLIFLLRHTDSLAECFCYNAPHIVAADI